MVDRRGTALTARSTGTNRHDSSVFEELVESSPLIYRPRGRVRKRPVKLYADKAYDIPRHWRFLYRRRIALTGADSSE